MICLWFQKAHEYSLRMVYEILYLVHLIQQPIPKSVKVWILHPLCQAEQSTKTPMQKSKQTGRQTNMHEFWVHFCVMSPHRSPPLPARSDSHNGAKSMISRDIFWNFIFTKPNNQFQTYVNKIVLNSWFLVLALVVE